MNLLADGALSARFITFAERECREYSPLYERLSRGVAADPDLLSLAAHARPGQPTPNLLFGAVHYLLLDRPAHPLASYYPSITAGTEQGNPFPLFRSFCFEHEAAIRALLQTRLVQTNEVRRSACLLPAFATVAERAHGHPLALIEVGPSAGLNLLPDRYGYTYDDGRRCGDAKASVQLTCGVRGEQPLPVPARAPQISFRVGLDLNPIDVCDGDATRWLRALVWPEHHERANLLLRAVHAAQEDPPRLLAGDALDLLPDVMAAVPPDATLCVFHSMAVNQFSAQARARLSELLARHSAERDIYRISLGDLFSDPAPGSDRPRPILALTTYRSGGVTEQLLARCEGHAAWIEWLGREV